MKKRLSQSSRASSIMSGKSSLKSQRESMKIAKNQVSISGFKSITPQATIVNFNDVKTEANRSALLSENEEFTQDEVEASVSETLIYQLENRLESDPLCGLVFIFFFFTLVIVALSFSWIFFCDLGIQRNHGEIDAEDSPYLQTTHDESSILQAMFFVTQVLTHGGFMDIPAYYDLQGIYILILLVGLILFSTLIAFITDLVQSYMNHLSNGSSKVVEQNHTLILGWNKSTPQLIIEIARLRNEYNNLVKRRFPILHAIFPFISVSLIVGLTGSNEVFTSKDATVLVTNDIVIMANDLSKNEMTSILRQELMKADIGRDVVKLGQNVICRVGSGDDLHDLVRVAAHKAGTILCMRSDDDIFEREFLLEKSGVRVSNGASVRTVLALRHCIFNNPFEAKNKLGLPYNPINPNLNIVVQLAEPMDEINAMTFKAHDGHRALHHVELSSFFNSLLFNSAAQPGLARALTKLLSFTDEGLRAVLFSSLKLDLNWGNIETAKDLTFRELQRRFTSATIVGLVRDPFVSTAIKQKQKHGGPSRVNRDINIENTAYGLCPDPNLTINENDLVIYIGDESMPPGGVRGLSGEIDFSLYDRRAETYMIKHIVNDSTTATTATTTDDDTNNTTTATTVTTTNEDTNTDWRLQSGGINRIRSNTLVVGWRNAWVGDVDHDLMGVYRFKQRLDELTVHQDQGSTITFINMVDEETWKDLMEFCDTESPKKSIWQLTYDYDNDGKGDMEAEVEVNQYEKKGITINHIMADVLHSEALRAVIHHTEPSLDTVIILGIEAFVQPENKRYSSNHLRDTYVHSIILRLRTYWTERGEDKSVHVIAEIDSDFSSKAALLPRNADDQSDRKQSIFHSMMSTFTDIFHKGLKMSLGKIVKSTRMMIGTGHNTRRSSFGIPIDKQVRRQSIAGIRRSSLLGGEMVDTTNDEDRSLLLQRLNIENFPLQRSNNNSGNMQVIVDPDFVNITQLSARVLTQVTAYPTLFELLINDMMNYRSDSTNLRVVRINSLVSKKGMNLMMPYGVLCRILEKTFVDNDIHDTSTFDSLSPPSSPSTSGSPLPSSFSSSLSSRRRAIAFGYIVSSTGSILFAPPLEQRILLNPNDSLIFLFRNLDAAEIYSKGESADISHYRRGRSYNSENNYEDDDENVASTTNSTRQPSLPIVDEGESGDNSIGSLFGRLVDWWVGGLVG